MVLLNHLLSLPAFTNAHIVSGYNGINTPVDATVLFDCDADSSYYRKFGSGQLVFTSLSAKRNQPDAAETVLRNLIHCGVAAIAVQTTFFQDISQELKQYSSEQNVPVFFFDGASLEEALYETRFELNRLNHSGTEEALFNLLHSDHLSDTKITELTYQLNPYFRDYIVLCAFVSVSGQNESLPDVLQHQYRLWGTNQHDYFEELGLNTVGIRNSIRYTTLPYKRGLFFLLTAETPISLPADGDVSLLRKMLPEGENYLMGISSSHGHISKMQVFLREALYANIASVIDDCPVTRYDECIVDKLLCSTTRFDVAKAVYNSMCRSVLEIGGKSNSGDYMTTLSTYVRMNGDIKATAEALYQHPNTIRYRINKIQTAWNCENDDFRFTGTAMIFARLENILRLMDLS